MIKHITFVRPALGFGPSADAMTPLVFALLRAATPPEIEAKLIDERVELDPILDARLCDPIEKLAEALQNADERLSCVPDCTKTK